MAGDRAESFVLDASVAAAWCFRDEASPATVYDAAYLDVAIQRGIALATRDRALARAATAAGVAVIDLAGPGGG